MSEKKGFPILFPNAAGIDISSKEHYVAVNPSSISTPIQSFGCFTEDLHAISAFLKQCNVDTVAMEATGIYWVSLFLVLEEAGFDVVLVNAKHVKNVRGKKTDMSDAEWIRQLHSCGLLSASFQPDKFTRTLRTYMRHRKNLIEMSATHIRMMHKALEQMNIKLQHVIADIMGKSGQLIIEAIINGQRDAESLSALCEGRIRDEKKPAIIKSLNGIWKEEHVFELKQCYELYLFYKTQLIACDKKIEELLSMETGITNAENKRKYAKSNKNNLDFDASAMLEKITGTDLTEIFGITSTNALEIISEVGVNMHKWPTVKHFTSWLNLAPNNKISGGKLLSSKIPKKKNAANQIFRFAAYAVQRSKNWLALFYHRIKAKAGVPKAIVATARKIAVIFYKMVKEKVAFNPTPIEIYSDAFKSLQVKKLKRQATALGFTVIEPSVT